MSSASKSKTVPFTKGPQSSILEYGKEIIRKEGLELVKLSESLGAEFEAAVKLILGAPAGSRIIVSGMGKAGYIGMKLSATLSSLGLPSFFLHPGDAVHGDLGRCSANDICIILSNSGETPEIIRLLPVLKRLGVQIISVTASTSSSLGKHSEVVLEIGELSEADPFDLAPTTTTTAMLAVGDALAITLAVERGFSPEDFARYHPGGSLGRALMLTSQIMRTGDAHCVIKKGSKVSDVLHAISSTKGRPGAAAIVDDSGTLVGIFTDGNLRRCLEQGSSFLEEPIDEVMSLSPKTVSPDKLVQETARILEELKVDQLIVVDDQNRPVGLVDVQDILAFKG